MYLLPGKEGTKQRGCARCLSVFLAVSLALALTVLHDCGAKGISVHVLGLVIYPDHLPNEQVLDVMLKHNFIEHYYMSLSVELQNSSYMSLLDMVVHHHCSLDCKVELNPHCPDSIKVPKVQQRALDPRLKVALGSQANLPERTKH